MNGYTKISKEDFYKRGGFANPRLVRVTRSKAYVYFEANLAQGRF